MPRPSQRAIARPADSPYAFNTSLIVALSVGVPVLSLAAAVGGAYSACAALSDCYDSVPPNSGANGANGADGADGADGAARGDGPLMAACYRPHRGNLWHVCSFVACARGFVPETGVLVGGVSGAAQGDAPAAAAHNLDEEDRMELTLRERLETTEERISALRAQGLTTAAIYTQLVRATCARGHRFVEDGRGGGFCTAQLAYPDALVLDAMGSSGNAMVAPSERACGAWLRTQDVGAGTSFSWSSAREMASAMWRLVQRRLGPDVSDDDAHRMAVVPRRASKLVQGCFEAVRTGRHILATGLAVEALFEGMDPPVDASSFYSSSSSDHEEFVLRGVGLLAAHGCPGPLRLSVHYPSETDPKLFATLVDGELPPSIALAAAITVVEQALRDEEEVEEGGGGGSTNAQYWDALSDSLELVETARDAALGKVWNPLIAAPVKRAILDCMANALTHEELEVAARGVVGSSVRIAYTPTTARRTLRTMSALKCTARHYGAPAVFGAMRLLAADCAAVAAQHMFGEDVFSTPAEDAVDEAMPQEAKAGQEEADAQARSQLAALPPLGRVRRWSAAGMSISKALEPPTEQEVGNVSRTLPRFVPRRTQDSVEALWYRVFPSRERYASGYLYRRFFEEEERDAEEDADGAEDAPEDVLAERAARRQIDLLEARAIVADRCFEATRLIAPDEMEEALYQAVVPRSLAQRMERLVETMRSAVAEVLTDARYGLARVFVDPESVASAIRTMPVRIAGAPTGALGRKSARLAADPDPSTGIVHALLGVHRAANRDVLRLAWGADPTSDPCDLPILYDAAEPNAYYLHTDQCVVLMLGLMHAPTADAAFDDASLYARVGFIVAHELAHATLATPRRRSEYMELLGAYPPSTHEEALADVVAMVALEHARSLGAFDASGCEQLMLHMAQLFCAVPDERAPPGTHPQGSERSNLLAFTLSSRLDLWCG